MRASGFISVTLDGVLYRVNPGEVVPARLIEYWTACNKIARMKAQGIIKDEAASVKADSPSNKIDKKEEKK